MKKILLGLLSVILILSLIGCAETEQSAKHDEVETITEIQGNLTNESLNYGSSADNEIASKGDIVNYLKDDYCSGITFNESPQSDGRVFYTSTDGNKEVLVFSDYVTYYDAINNLDIAFYFDGFVDDSQKLRIKVTDGMFSSGLKPISEDNSINIMLSMLDVANVKEEISTSQIKSGMQLKKTLFAMKTYEYQYNDDILFILEECLDNQGQSVIKYNLYCDIF